jgi:hypothetical protein
MFFFYKIVVSTKNITALWDGTPSSLLDGCSLHAQSRTVSFESSDINLPLEDESNAFIRNVGIYFDGIHYPIYLPTKFLCDTFQKTVISASSYSSSALMD